MTEFSEYVQSFYDQIEIDEELLAKFDVVTIPKLDGQLYTFG
jgi:truncated hemoglobin YjbI